MATKSNLYSVDASYRAFDTRSNYNVDTPRVIKAVNTFTGVDLPGHRRIISKKGDATTTATGEMHRMEISPGLCQWNFYDSSTKKRWSEGVDGIYRLPVYENPPVTSDAKATNLAMGSYYSSIAEARSQFKGLAFLGELGKTMQLISQPTKGVSKLIDSYYGRVKKLSGYKWKHVANDINSLYLELTFGWTPLLLDIRSAIQATNTLVAKKPSIRVHGFGKDVTKSSLTDDRATLDQGNNFVRETIKIEASVEVSITGSIGLITEGAHRVPSMLGLRSGEFVPTLWELLPYSFIVDYFSNVGDVLNAYSNLDVVPTYNCKTVRRVGLVDYNCRTIDSTNNGFQTSSGTQSYSSSRTQLSRSRFTPFVPSFSVSLPEGRQWVNIASVVAAGGNLSRSFR